MGTVRTVPKRLSSLAVSSPLIFSIRSPFPLLYSIMLRLSQGGASRHPHGRNPGDSFRQLPGIKSSRKAGERREKHGGKEKNHTGEAPFRGTALKDGVCGKKTGLCLPVIRAKGGRPSWMKRICASDPPAVRARS